jgi:hypothetical protein
VDVVGQLPLRGIDAAVIVPVVAGMGVVLVMGLMPELDSEIFLSAATMISVSPMPTLAALLRTKNRK